jgi:hypothetical protein
MSQKRVACKRKGYWMSLMHCLPDVAGAQTVIKDNLRASEDSSGKRYGEKAVD